jgi:hypothetical protein
VPDLLLNPATKKLLDAYVSNPSHALCLTGEEGVGLGTIAKMLTEKLSNSPQTVTWLAPEKGLLSIDRIRALYEQTRSIQQDKRCVVIDDADSMSRDAQNALLKLLEEPVKNVHFILTTHQPSQLLTTIQSRVQTVQVLLVDEASSMKLVSSPVVSETERRQMLFLASGKPAELIRLADDKDYFMSEVGIITDARTFLQDTAYGRLAVIKKYTERLVALQFLTMCAKLLNFSLIKQRNYAAADSMEVLDDVMKRLEANGHVRTHLMDLVTKLP